jgi:putative oxidoreductase
MNYITRINQWREAHRPKWMDFIRIILGLFLLLKGVKFATNMNKLMFMMNDLPFGNFMMINLAQYVLFAHIFGGFFLATGLLTRFACIIQVPILLVAVFTNLFYQFPELILSIVVLLLLMYFLVVGSGRWSLDWYINMEDEKRMRHERNFY